MPADPTRPRRLPEFLPRGGSLPPEAWRARHLGIVVLLWCHSVFIPAFAIVRGYGITHAAIESMIVPAIAAIASWPLLNRRARTVAASLGLLTCSGILVHLSGGTIEAHFHYFVSVAIIALYQDWLPFLTAIVFVFVHHGVLGAIDPSSVYNHAAAQRDPWTWAAIHAFFIAGISAACLVNWRLNEKTLDERRRAEDQLRLLADASRALTSSLELDLMLHELAAVAVPALADYCVIDLTADDGEVRRATLVARTDLPAAPDDDRDGRVDPSAEEHPVVVAIRTGQTQVVSDGSVNMIVAPLVGRHATMGTISLASTPVSGRRYDTGDAAFAEELARRVAIAVENAQLYARQRTVAATLQHSLLPERMPDIPGVSAAARYIAGADVEVGGDWYDLVQLATGEVAVTMGDVVGRGERAASLMGQLRNAVRAYALDGKSPEDIAACVNVLLLDAGAEHMATMVFAVLDPERETLRLVNAGHPPPLMVGADRRLHFVDGAGGTPLGASASGRFREQQVAMPAGSTLVLYTDGLVEDRRAPIADGLDHLREVVAAGPSPLEELCDHVLAQLHDGRRTSDDTAILALRLDPVAAELHLRLPARPATLPGLRAVLRRWLRQQGAAEHECFELLVASGEAAANAIRHATGPRASHFFVDAFVDGAVEICVRDSGAWRERRSDEGGRGLAIIESFVDDLAIDRSPAGTTVRMRRRLDLRVSA